MLTEEDLIHTSDEQKRTRQELDLRRLSLFKRRGLRSHKGLCGTALDQCLYARAPGQPSLAAH